MYLISLIVENMMTIFFLFLYIGIITILVTLELIFIKHRKKGEWICPIVVIIFSLIFSYFSIKSSMYSNVNIVKLDVIDDSQQSGTQYALIDYDRKVVAIGQFIVNDGNQIDIYNLNVDNGHILDAPDEYVKKISIVIKQQKINIKDYTGSSVTYEQLLKYQNLNENICFTYTHIKLMLINLLLINMPAFLLISIFAYTRIYRHKKNMLMRVKLKDL